MCDVWKIADGKIVINLCVVILEDLDKPMGTCVRVYSKNAASMFHLSCVATDIQAGAASRFLHPACYTLNGYPGILLIKDMM